VDLAGQPAQRKLRYNEPIASKEIAMLTKEMKLQAFMKLRTENYRASLRLEGLTPRPVVASKPAPTPSAPKIKHAR